MPKVAILDAGSQFGKLIDKKVRWLSVESEIYPIHATIEDIWDNVQAIIISGWPESVTSQWAPMIHESILNSRIPILGICYGHQLLNHIAWWSANSLDIREDGPVKISVVDKDSVLFQNTPENQTVLMAHGDSITHETVWKWFRVTAISDNGIVAAMENKQTNTYSTQFHPETDITEYGEEIISNFLDWVDSTVLARLLVKALDNDQLLLLHVDNWFMREGESEIVVEEFKKIKMKVEVALAWQQFLDAYTDINWMQIWPLKSTTNPEHKRKIIGDTFMKVAEEKISEAIQARWWNIDDIMIAQGTLRPDLIESASKLASSKADAIKTHHNDTELVRKKREQWKILEPLQEYHKDEVRALWESLWLPHDLVWRQPFPWPGLWIRILCAEIPYIDERFDATNILLKKIVNFSEENKDDIKKLYPDNKIPEQAEKKLKKISSNLHATLLPIQTVWVQWDGRTYSYAVSLSGEWDWEDFFFLADIIPKLSNNINRIVYNFWDKIDSDVRDITPTYLSEKTASKLRKADKIVNDILIRYNLMETLSQVPVVLVPLPFWEEWNHSIVIRTFITNDFMTGVPAIPWKNIPIKTLHEMKDKIQSLDGISRVMYDLTSKPPGTTEWE